MNADDLDELYKLVRGNRAAPLVLDARGAFVDGKYAEACWKLTDAKVKFVESRSRLLKQDATKLVDPNSKDWTTQVKRLERKRKKVLTAVEQFEQLLPKLQRLADRELDQVMPKSSDSSILPHNTPLLEAARPDDVSESFLDAFQCADREEQLELIGDSFGFREISDESLIIGDAVYYIRTETRTLLVRTNSDAAEQSRIELTRMSDGRTIKPLTRKALMSLGRHRQMILLTKAAASAGPGGVSAASAGPDGLSAASAGPDGLSAASAGPDGLSADSDSGKPRTQSSSPGITDQQLLDMGAFSQLLSAAQRSGIVDGAEQIGYVRDREFKKGNFDQAFQIINGLYTRFTANANQRARRIAREDADIAAGRVEMLPKDVQAKKLRDRNQSEEIERATRRFQVVLEGLRLLMNRNN